MSVRHIPLAVSLAAIAALDLSNVKRKLQRPKPHGNGWSEACCESAEKWYKRYLTLIVKYPTQKVVPNAMIDEIWHGHITDTQAYAKDCQAIFGTFVHHNPYFGMNGDGAERDEAFRITNELFVKEFGEDCRKEGDVALECSVDCGWVDVAPDKAIPIMEVPRPATNNTSRSPAQEELVSVD